MAAIARSLRSSATRTPLTLTQLLSTRLSSSASHSTTSRLLRAAAVPLAGSGSVRPYLLSPSRNLSDGAVRSDAAPKPGNNGRPDKAPAEMGPLFPGCDYMHWLIVMDKPGGEGATKQQMIDCYIKTLAEVLGSEEEAKKKIYNVSCDRYFGFGCEIDEETSNKLEGLPGVLFVLPDSYVDPEYKDYGAELFVNGEIVQRPPERQRRVEPQPQRGHDRPRSGRRR